MYDYKLLAFFILSPANDHDAHTCIVAGQCKEVDHETNNHFVQSLSLRIPVKRISVLCFEYFASFLDGEILINCLELNLLQYQNFCK
ncbi:hypothetical protein Avbf_16959 [Armadillidium vulgare]|nr:hypothetical protein Avbf_16959 [Armadillidium vulgare]